jgi:hypothetical protein
VAAAGQFSWPPAGSYLAVSGQFLVAVVNQRLTATVTATAAANGYQQRSATAHNARTIGANLGYVRPEKRKVGGSTRP